MAQWEGYETWLEKTEEEQFSARSDPRLLSAPSVKEDVRLSALTNHPSTIGSSTSEIPAKRQFRREVISIPSSPPLKRAVPAAKVAFCSPDREHLREVLQSGGAADIDLQEVLNLQHENIEFFPIPTRPLSDILKNPEYHAFRLDTEAGHSGQLAVQTDPEKKLGTGGFKTAHPGFLSLLSAPGTTLCSRQRQKVAVKRFFYKKYPPGGSAEMMDFGFGRYTIADELPKLFREANVLYWASSLLTSAYEYIDHCISASSDPPPFYIPRLRFVEAGLVLSCHQAQPTGGPGPGQKSKPLSPRAAFLVEELINDTFLKYIHNMDCNPLLDPDEPGYRIAEFLACTQHIQYAKTGSLAFISDYQGGSELLSDPQVLTHPLVNEGKDVFGDGNIELPVSTFEKKHICNDYCTWSGFKLQRYGAVETEST